MAPSRTLGFSGNGRDQLKEIKKKVMRQIKQDRWA